MVDEVFAGKFTFRHAGLSPVEVEAEQLRGAAGTVLLAQKEPKEPSPWHILWSEGAVDLRKFLTHMRQRNDIRKN